MSIDFGQPLGKTLAGRAKSDFREQVVRSSSGTLLTRLDNAGYNVGNLRSEYLVTFAYHYVDFLLSGIADGKIDHGGEVALAQLNRIANEWIEGKIIGEENLQQVVNFIKAQTVILWPGIARPAGSNGWGIS